ncbi:hypothetical protein ACTHPJ_24070 [Paenibacillus amylolyticus]|uniref:hypothetical protein n=1 Tax=Paenibacillus TaxID=44249 RepID=UPI0030D47E10
MKITLTFSELSKLGVWIKYCDMTDKDFELVRDNLSHTDQEFVLTKEQLDLLGLHVSVTRSE